LTPQLICYFSRSNSKLKMSRRASALRMIEKRDKRYWDLTVSLREKQDQRYLDPNCFKPITIVTNVAEVLAEAIATATDENGVLVIKDVCHIIAGKMNEPESEFMQHLTNSEDAGFYDPYKPLKYTQDVTQSVLRGMRLLRQFKQDVIMRKLHVSPSGHVSIMELIFLVHEAIDAYTELYTIGKLFNTTNNFVLRDIDRLFLGGRSYNSEAPTMNRQDNVLLLDVCGLKYPSPRYSNTLLGTLDYLLDKMIHRWTLLILLFSADFVGFEALEQMMAHMKNNSAEEGFDTYIKKVCFSSNKVYRFMMTQDLELNVVDLGEADVRVSVKSAINHFKLYQDLLAGGLSPKAKSVDMYLIATVSIGFRIGALRMQNQFAGALHVHEMYTAAEQVGKSIMRVRYHEGGPSVNVYDLFARYAFSCRKVKSGRNQTLYAGGVLLDLLYRVQKRRTVAADMLDVIQIC
jgi:hypothetical protein